MKASHVKKEDLLMPEIIRYLRSLGGVAAKREIVAELKESSNIPEAYIEEVRTSKKTNKTYKSFDFNFNFATKHLSYAGYLEYTDDHRIKLTELGRKVDLNNFDPDKMVRAISQPVFDQKSEKKSQNKKLEKESEEPALEEETTENQWRAELSESLKKMSPQKFELFARRLVKEMGVNLDENIGINYVADGGLDGFGYITSGDFRTARVAIQAKRWSQPVGSPEIDKFRGAMDKFNAEFGIFITTSTFSRKAIEASRTGTRVITLIDGEKIADLVEKFQLYVRPVTTYVLDDFYTAQD